MRIADSLLRMTAAAVMIGATAGCGSDSKSKGNDAGADGGDGCGPSNGVVAAGVRWFGRVDTTNPDQPRFSWSGTGFIARFNGTSLAAQLTISGSSQIFKAVVDDAPQAAMTGTAGQATYMLASGLPAGVHTVELYRQTEGPQGETRLMGLMVGDGALMDPPPGCDRLIEVIGDSITCGYGDLGTLADTDCYPTESHWDTY